MNNNKKILEYIELQKGTLPEESEEIEHYKNEGFNIALELIEEYVEQNDEGVLSYIKLQKGTLPEESEEVEHYKNEGFNIALELVEEYIENEINLSLSSSSEVKEKEHIAYTGALILLNNKSKENKLLSFKKELLESEDKNSKPIYKELLKSNMENMIFHHITLHLGSIENKEDKYLHLKGNKINIQIEGIGMINTNKEQAIALKVKFFDNINLEDNITPHITLFIGEDGKPFHSKSIKNWVNFKTQHIVQARIEEFNSKSEIVPDNFDTTLSNKEINELEKLKEEYNTLPGLKSKHFFSMKKLINKSEELGFDKVVEKLNKGIVEYLRKEKIRDEYNESFSYEGLTI